MELLIARRLLKGGNKGSVSAPIVRIAQAGIVLGVCVMLLSICITGGFKREITEKLTGFVSHVDIGSYGGSSAYADEHIRVSDTLLANMTGLPEVREASVYVRKPAILKTGREIHGAMLHGVNAAYRGDFFKKEIREGTFPDFSTEQASDRILLSASVARLLNLKTGDKLQAHFVQDPPRVRVFTVSGIYDTGFREYDDVFVLCDIRHLQRLNGWEPEEVSGISVTLWNIGRLHEAVEKIEGQLDWKEGGDFYRIDTLYGTAPEIFDWLNLLNMNVWIILILVILVAGMNMVSGLLILILDKTALIGVLKALGYRNVRLRRLFLYVTAGLVGKGMLWGNAAALLLAGLQYFFRLIPLDPESYYMDTVPVSFDWLAIIGLNAGVWLVSVLMLIVPTVLISGIQPVRAIRFE